MLRSFFALTTFIFACCASAAMPEEIAQALASFHAEGTKGWGFLQTTSTAEHNMAERYAPANPLFSRWTLEKKDGRAPTEQETRTYRDMQSSKPREETAPNVKNQIIPDSCERVSETPTEAVYRFRLKPGTEDDKSAQHMVADFTLHRPSGTISTVSLHSFEPFSPMFGVSISEIMTQINYSLPEAGRPTLLKKISVKIRGRAMLIKSLDQDMTVEYSEYTAPSTP